MINRQKILILFSSFVMVTIGLIVFFISIHEIFELIKSINQKSPIVEVSNAAFGIASLGVSISLIGAMLFFTVGPDERQPPAASFMFAGVLAFLAIAILFLVIGSALMSVAMTRADYKSCRTWHGVRMSVTTWAHVDRGCDASTAP